MHLSFSHHTHSEPTEALKPKHTYNPVLQHFYQCVQKRAMNPDAPLPPLDPTIAQYVNPDAELFEHASAALQQVAEQFTLTKTDHKQKLARKYWKDQLADATCGWRATRPMQAHRRNRRKTVWVRTQRPLIWTRSLAAVWRRLAAFGRCKTFGI